MTTLLSLYPRAWRERYEDEFIAILEARPPDAHDRIDIIRGAIDARLHPRADLKGSLEPPLPVPYHGPWNIRRAGQITLIGGVVYLLTIWLAINGPIVQDDGGTYRDGSAGFPTLFLSVVLLLFGAWAVAATLPNPSSIVRAATAIAATAGILWAAAPWMFPFGAVLCLGLVVLAIEAARTRRWRWSDAGVLVAGVVGAFGMVACYAAGIPLSIDVPPINEADIQYVMFLLLAPLWFATAHALLRPAIPIAERGRPRVSAPESRREISPRQGLRPDRARSSRPDRAGDPAPPGPSRAPGPARGWSART